MGIGNRVWRLGRETSPLQIFNDDAILNARDWYLYMNGYDLIVNEHVGVDVSIRQSQLQLDVRDSVGNRAREDEGARILNEYG